MSLHPDSMLAPQIQASRPVKYYYPSFTVEFLMLSASVAHGSVGGRRRAATTSARPHEHSAPSPSSHSRSVPRLAQRPVIDVVHDLRDGCALVHITALIVVIAFAVIAAQLLVALVESFIVIGAGILFLGFAGSRWTKFFTERYLSYVASVGVKLFVLYLIMGVGMGIAVRWMPILERGDFSPIPFFYVMGGSLVFVFLIWHIPSVAGSMMAGTVSLSFVDAVHPAILGSRAAGVGLVTAGAIGAAAVGGVRWGLDRLRVHASLHTTTTGQSLGTETSVSPASVPGRARRRPGPGRPDVCTPASSATDG
jgi:TrbL/VirB6 plasmid conjugal transfer protein